ncbi:hypothetical protein D3C79_1042410 [compost metagenome]
MHGGGGMDHHRIRAARQQPVHLGKALWDPVLAAKLVQHRRVAGAEQRGDPLIAGEQRQIGLLGDITEANQGNAHGNSLS